MIPKNIINIKDNAFSGCNGLNSITISDGVTSIEENTFYGCSSLTDIVIPDSVTEIGEDAFSECTSLQEIIIPSSVKTIESCTFMKCDNLKKVVFKDSNLKKQYKEDPRMCVQILPTTACNFKCPYCYQEGICRDKALDENTVDLIHEFMDNYIEANDNIKKIHLIC